MYRSVLRTDCRVSLKPPKKDDCGTCTFFKDQLSKLVEGTETYHQVLEEYEVHKSRNQRARQQYQRDAEIDCKTHRVYAADLQKVLLLPWAPKSKDLFFLSKLTIFNETFAPLLKNASYPSVNVVWHEGIQGRKASNIIQAVDLIMIKAVEDGAEEVTLWLDNCFAQLKNYYILTYLVHIVNSTSLRVVTLKYLVSGHTFMAADSVHGSIEKAIDRKSPVYDFDTLLNVIANSRRNNIAVACTVFKKWPKLKKSKLSTTVDWSQIVEISAKKGIRTVFFRNSFDEPEKELDFLQKKARFPLKPEKLEIRGVNKNKLEKLKAGASKFMNCVEKHFWEGLKEANVNDLGKNMM